MIKHEINQTILPSGLRLSDTWIKRLLRAIEKRLRLRGNRTLSIAFVDHRTMRRLNRTYRGKDKVTDILSFATAFSPLMGENKREGDRPLGELLLAWPYVQKQAKQNKNTLEQELALLLIHGCLHLLGYDHETPRDARKMLPLQGKIIVQFIRKENREKRT